MAAGARVAGPGPPADATDTHSELPFADGSTTDARVLAVRGALERLDDADREL